MKTVFSCAVLLAASFWSLRPANELAAMKLKTP
jgi:hypothetical protein